MKHEVVFLIYYRIKPKVYNSIYFIFSDIQSKRIWFQKEDASQELSELIKKLLQNFELRREAIQDYISLLTAYKCSVRNTKKYILKTKSAQI